VANSAVSLDDKLIIMMDFDGTISQMDVAEIILTDLTSGDWQALDELFLKGEISLREAFKGQFEMIQTTPDEMKQSALKGVIDPFFHLFIEQQLLRQNSSLILAIVSDGFHFYIEQLLKPVLGSNYGQLFIYSNDVRFEKLNENDKDNKQSLKVIFRNPECDHGCANCKLELVEKYQKEGFKVVYIGDGLSDFYPATEADLVYAKKGKRLEKYCLENKIEHFSFSSFKELIDLI
jgi:2,3-diketo-5-methylthio-1-phosphopentane phosphatase